MGGREGDNMFIWHSLIPQRTRVVSIQLRRDPILYTLVYYINRWLYVPIFCITLIIMYRKFYIFVQISKQNTLTAKG